MRIALLLPTLNGGGAQHVFLTLSEELGRRGYDVELVVGQRRGHLIDAVPDTVTTIDLGCRRLRAALPAFVRYLRVHRPACVLSTLHHANCLAIAGKKLARTRTKVIVRVAQTLSYDGPVSPSTFRPVTLALARRLYPSADLVVAVSEDVARELVSFTRLPPGLVTTIPSPVVGHDVALKSHERIDHPWFQAGQPPVVLGMGRLDPDKNFQALLRAFKEVRSTMLAHLVVLGEGDERPRLMELAESLGLSADFALPGFLHNPYPYLARAGVYVLSSNREGLPGGLIQAMACGVTVVATDCPTGPREILRGGEFGRLVPLGDVPALARAIHSALDSPQPAPPHAVLPYSTELAADRYERAIRRVVSS